jgi:16S rRNA pseudouridine516 synthase
MSNLIRLDKFLSHVGLGTRAEVKKLLKKGLISHNKITIVDPSYKILTDDQLVGYNGQLVSYEPLIYIMLNKPKNVVSATKDNHDRTVIDIISHPAKHKLFPVGRLDKDTTGLLLITNDGKLSHELLSPKKHVDKTYITKVIGLVSLKTVNAFNDGITLEDGYKTMSSKLRLIEQDEDTSIVEITIKEGKFHQIKRMFDSVAMKVIELERISMGNLVLDESLKLGESRFLTKEEVHSLETR